MTQIRSDGSLGQAYYECKKADGMSTTEAIRRLKRRSSRTVFNLLEADQHVFLIDLATAA